MTTTYQVASGWNNAAGLADLSPQPATPAGVQIPAEVITASGAVYADGSYFVDLVFTAVSTTQRNTLCTALGVSQSTRSAQMTMAIRQDDSTFSNWNVVVRYPKSLKRDPIGFRDLVFRVVLVQAI